LSLPLVAAAVLVAVGLLPWTFEHWSKRISPPEKRLWRMPDLHNITQTEAVRRFGKPLSARDFSLNDGSFIGPRYGLKRFYPLDAPDYAARMEAKGAVAWSFPRFSIVREIIWKLPDSYLTAWFHQPRAEIDFQGEQADLTLPPFAPGEWVALDHCRVGKDLVAKPPASP
jgi:hypothetical protein